MTYPLPMTREEAYLAYKAGVVEEGDLKPSLNNPRNQLEAWLAYWTGLTDDYPKNKDNSPLMITDEEACIAFLSGATDSYPTALKDPRDPRMVGYLKYLISARFGRPYKPFNRPELYLSLIKPPVVTNDTPSSDITLTGTCEAPFIDVKIYGDTIQNSYSGKNLLNPFIKYDQGTTQILSGVSVTFNNDQSITLNGTMNANNVEITGAANVLNIPIDATKTYYAYIKVLGGSVNVNNGRFAYECRYNDGASVTYRDNGYNGNSQLLTLNTDNTQYITRVRFYNGSSATTPTVFNNWRVQIGIYAEEYADFEPYVGGAPAPSPSYPQAVNVVTGRQVVEVSDGGSQSQEYEIALTSKNLFDKSSVVDGAIELCKIGDYQDYLYRDADGDWYMHKVVAKYKIEDLVWDESLADGFIRFVCAGLRQTIVHPSNSNVRGVGKCNKYAISTAGHTYGSYDNTFGLASNGNLYVSDSVYHSAGELDSWKTARAGTEFYLALVDPIDTEITNTALIEQLDALVEGGSYQDTTYIEISATDPNLPALLKVEAGAYR